MEDRDKALHKFLEELDKYDLVNFANQGSVYTSLLTGGPKTYAVNSEDSEEIDDTLLENAISFLDAYKNRNQEEIPSLAKKLEGSIELQETIGVISKKVTNDLINQLQNISDSGKWSKGGNPS